MGEQRREEQLKYRQLDDQTILLAESGGRELQAYAAKR